MCERKGADGRGPELHWWLLGGWLAGCLAGRQASWLLGRLAGWLVGRAPGWSALGWITGWPVGCVSASVPPSPMCSEANELGCPFPCLCLKRQREREWSGGVRLAVWLVGRTQAWPATRLGGQVVGGLASCLKSLLRPTGWLAGVAARPPRRVVGWLPGWTACRPMAGYWIDSLAGRVAGSSLGWRLLHAFLGRLVVAACLLARLAGCPPACSPSYRTGCPWRVRRPICFRRLPTKRVDNVWEEGGGW